MGVSAAKESGGRRDREALSNAIKERHEGEVCVLSIVAFRGGRIFNLLTLNVKITGISPFDLARIRRIRGIDFYLKPLTMVDRVLVGLDFQSNFDMIISHFD